MQESDFDMSIGIQKIKRNRGAAGEKQADFSLSAKFSHSGAAEAPFFACSRLQRHDAAGWRRFPQGIPVSSPSTILPSFLGEIPKSLCFLCFQWEEISPCAAAGREKRKKRTSLSPAVDRENKPILRSPAENCACIEKQRTAILPKKEKKKQPWLPRACAGRLCRSLLIGLAE